MKMDGWYNGYSWSERYASLKVLKRHLASKELPPASGPCDLCGDPVVPVEYHSEDYSQPYLWGPPAMFSLCRTCHRHKLHKRFLPGTHWQVFLAHVRRGGYARDLKDPAIKKELARYRAAMEQGEQPILRQLRPYKKKPGAEWFSLLSLNRAMMSSPRSRPRP